MEKTKKGEKEVNPAMNKYLKLVIMIAVLLVVGTAAFILGTQNAPSPPTDILGPRQIPLDRFNFDRNVSFIEDIELFYIAKTVLSTINATILIFLLVTYVDMYRKLKSEFTIGLILFSLILLLYALTSNPLMQRLFGFWGFGLGPFAMLPDLCTTLALAVLVYLTMK